MLTLTLGGCVTAWTMEPASDRRREYHLEFAAAKAAPKPEKAELSAKAMDTDRESDTWAPVPI